MRPKGGIEPKRRIALLFYAAGPVNALRPSGLADASKWTLSSGDAVDLARNVTRFV